MSNPSNANFGQVAKQSFQEFGDDDMSTHAAALSYQLFFALFPFVIFVLAFLGLLGLSNFFDWLLGQAETVVPSNAFGAVEGIISDIRGSASGGIFSIGVMLALWSASSVTRRTMHALNVAYDVEEERPAWKKFPLSLLYTFLFAVLIIPAVGMFTFGRTAAEWVAQQVGFGSTIVTLWTWARIPLAVLLMILVVAMIYYLFPNVRQPFRLITPGAVIAVVIWILASLGFSFYVSNFGSYSATYGALAAVIVLLLYFYISASVLLLGAEINAEIYHQVAEDDEGKKDDSEKDSG